MSDKRSSSFRNAVHFKDQDIWIEQGFKSKDSHSNKLLPHCFDKMVKAIAHHFLHDERDRKYYADSYSCRPPPLFILMITLIEVSFILCHLNKFLLRYLVCSPDLSPPNLMLRLIVCWVTIVLKMTLTAHLIVKRWLS